MATDRVFLTGASGFVGAHILDALLAAGYRVRALMRTDDGAGHPYETVTGDLLRPGELTRALDGCRYLIHCAALYSFAPRDRAAIHAVNVDGTSGLFDAAYIAGVERAVLTSSSAAVGPAHGDALATENDVPPPHASHDRHRSEYHVSKVLQERAAFASRLPTVALLPTAPIGPGDHKPTPTGAMVLDFARGNMFAKPPGAGGMNLVAVEDVARAHVAALEHGRPGERYIIGGENCSFDRIWAMLAEASGARVPAWRVPATLALGIAYADDVRCRIVPQSRPFVPLEGVRLSLERMYVDSSKAMRELGHAPQPVAGALVRAIAWYREHGYLS